MPLLLCSVPLSISDRSLVYPSVRSPSSNSSFKVVCYNVLAEIYANQQIYPYCPAWALAWNYRRTNILRELLQYGGVTLWGVLYVILVMSFSRH